MLNRHEYLLKIVGWGVATFLILGGWFINPSTTHYTITQKGNNGCINSVIEVDRISLRGDIKIGVDTDPTTHQAYDRAVALILFAIIGLLLWWSAILFILFSSDFTSEGKKEDTYKVYISFAKIVTFLYLILIGDVVDVYPILKQMLSAVLKYFVNC